MFFFSRSGPETREAFSDEPGDIMTVQIPVFDLLEVDLTRRGGLMSEIGHAGLHLFGDLDNDVPVPNSGLKLSKRRKPYLGEVCSASVLGGE